MSTTAERVGIVRCSVVPAVSVHSVRLTGLIVCGHIVIPSDPQDSQSIYLSLSWVRFSAVDICDTCLLVALAWNPKDRGLVQKGPAGRLRSYSVAQ